MWTLVKNLYLNKPLKILHIWENCVLLECNGASFSQWKIKPIQIHCSMNHPGYNSHRVICQHVLTVSKPNTFLWWNISHYEVTLLGKCSCKISSFFWQNVFWETIFWRLKHPFNFNGYQLVCQQVVFLTCYKQAHQSVQGKRGHDIKICPISK